jgi:hypothetical protein
VSRETAPVGPQSAAGLAAKESGVRETCSYALPCSHLALVSVHDCHSDRWAFECECDGVRHADMARADDRHGLDHHDGAVLLREMALSCSSDDGERFSRTTALSRLAEFLFDLI